MLQAASSSRTWHRDNTAVLVRLRAKASHNTKPAGLLFKCTNRFHEPPPPKKKTDPVSRNLKHPPQIVGGYRVAVVGGRGATAAVQVEHLLQLGRRVHGGRRLANLPRYTSQQARARHRQLLRGRGLQERAPRPKAPTSPVLVLLVRPGVPPLLLPGLVLLLRVLCLVAVPLGSPLLLLAALPLALLLLLLQGDLGERPAHQRTVEEGSQVHTTVVVGHLPRSARHRSLGHE
mmetsp:Transcript_35801/g.77889  ORF Transcript_35801/g.77889 Transcript_35801/m.77889 type:complete len:232 (+) Transcript_35801:596-1291(+)